MQKKFKVYISEAKLGGLSDVPVGHTLAGYCRRHLRHQQAHNTPSRKDAVLRYLQLGPGGAEPSVCTAKIMLQGTSSLDST